MLPEVEKQQTSLLRGIQEELELQPVLFIGAGLSKRYFGGPSWLELLRGIVDLTGLDLKLDYVVQKNDGDLARTASDLVDPIFEWAWNEGKNQFPQEMFSASVPRDSFLKFLACSVLSSLMKKAPALSAALKEEAETLSKVSPQAIITTNFDDGLCNIFQGYKPIVGKDVYRHKLHEIGEIYQVHGSVSKPETLVLTADDYSGYESKRPYFSAKMVTMFAEHPVVVLGYSVHDPNVAKIICDVGDVIADDNGHINNIVYVEWVQDAGDGALPSTVGIKSGDRVYTIHRIVVDSFEKIYETLSEPAALSGIKPQVLRALVSKVSNLVRKDAPKKKFDVTYEDLEKLISEDETIPKLLGFGPLPSSNASHPYTMTQIAHLFGFKTFNDIQNKVIKPLEAAGHEIKATDNKYHECIKTGIAAKSRTRKYSKEFADLCGKVLKGEPYQVDL